MRSTDRSTALRIVGIYFIVGAVWILVSDRTVQALIEDPALLSRVQTFKGWFFIIATSLLLYLLVREGIAHLERLRAGRQRVANDLAEKDRVLATLLRNLPGMAYRCRNDQDWTMEFVSGGCEDLTGYDPADLIENEVISYGELIHTEDRERVWRDVQAALAEDRTFQLSYRLRTKDGSEKWVWEQGCGVHDGQGRLVALEGFITDITEQKESETRVLHLEKLANMGLLTGAIAHDFNNILSVVTGLSRLRLAEIGHDDPARGDMEEIFKAGQRGAELTSQLLSFARPREARRTTVALNDLVEELLGMLDTLMGRSIQVNIRLHEEPLFISADGSKVQQILMNLAVNARDAMPDGGTLTVETSLVELDEAHLSSHEGARAGPHTMLAVSDTGIGMDPATQARIFDPFFTTKEAGKGTGLGLSTVYGIVKQSGGNIWIYSTPGRGTTFKVYFPAVDAAGKPVTMPTDVQALRGGTETVLLVEDEQGILVLMEMSLRRWGYTVLSAASGESALNLARSHPGSIDLIVSDLILPGMTGNDLVRQLVHANGRPGAIFISGYTDAASVGQSLLEPGMPFLQKPFTIEALVREVRHALDGLPRGG